MLKQVTSMLTSIASMYYRNTRWISILTWWVLMKFMMFTY